MIGKLGKLHVSTTHKIVIEGPPGSLAAISESLADQVTMASTMDGRANDSSAGKRTSRTAAFAGATGEAYITTIAAPYPGFIVAVPLSDPTGAYLRRAFAGLKHGQDIYLKRAIRWRDAAYKRLHGTAPPVRAFHRTQANGSTDYPGVSRQTRRIRSRHDRSRVYEVQVFIAVVWLVPGRDGMRPKGARSRQFSIGRYGHDEALRRAVQWHEEAKLALERGQALP